MHVAQTLGLILVVACAPIGFPPDTVIPLRDGVDHMTVEQQAHGAVVAAASGEAILAIEGEHAVHVREEFRAIRSALDRLAASCILANRYPIDTGPMHDALQDVRFECDEHDIRIRSASDRGAMLDEEMRHNATMLDALAALRAQRDRLFKHESEAENCR
jgi:hypothetical protein